MTHLAHIGLALATLLAHDTGTRFQVLHEQRPGWTRLEGTTGASATYVLSRRAMHCRRRECRSVVLTVTPDEKTTGLLLGQQGQVACRFTLTVELLPDGTGCATLAGCSLDSWACVP